jgi:hypothetical protein
VTTVEPYTFVIHYPEQITAIFKDKYYQSFHQDYHLIQGLLIKYTNATRFVFLNDFAGEEGSKL